MANMENQNKKAILDMFSLEDAKSMCEAFGGQLEADAPIDADDDKEYGLEDMMTVNPYEGQTDGEAFMQEEDDMKSPETQKFVIDEFAKEAAKLPGNTIEVSDIPSLATVIQAQNGIKGDVAGFLEKVMMDTSNRLSSQNTSDALPSGAAAQDGFKQESEVPMDNGVMGDVPAMDTVAPTAEPSLQANADDNGLGIEDDFGGDLGNLDMETSTEGDGAEPTDGVDFGNLDSMNDEDLWSDEPVDTTADGDADKPADVTDDLIDEPTASDEPKPEDDEPKETEDKPADEQKSEDDKPAESDDKDDAPSEDDFDFESIKKEANGVFESTDEPTPAATEEPAPAATEEPAPEATPVETEQPTVTATDECGETCANGVCKENIQNDEEKLTGQLESIRQEYNNARTAELVAAKVESYMNNAKKTNTLAQLESVVNRFKAHNAAKQNAARQDAKLNEIAENYAKSSAALESVKQPSAFEMINSAKKTITEKNAKLESIKKQHEKETEAKLDAIVESVRKENDTDAKLNALVESVRAAKKAETEQASLQKDLDAIVESVKSV